MKLFEILRHGDKRHTGIDQMMHELYERVAVLEDKVLKTKGSSKPPKDKDGNNVNQ